MFEIIRETSNPWFLEITHKMLAKAGINRDPVAICSHHLLLNVKNDLLVDILTLSWRRLLSYRNQSIDLRSKSMDWFLYDNGLRYERVKQIPKFMITGFRGILIAIVQVVNTMQINN